MRETDAYGRECLSRLSLGATLFLRQELCSRVERGESECMRINVLRMHTMALAGKYMLKSGRATNGFVATSNAELRFRGLRRRIVRTM